MLSRIIRNIKLPAWVTENSRLRNTALLAAGLLTLDLVLYAVLVVPAKERLTVAEAKYTELKKRRTEAVLFLRQRQELLNVKTGMPTQKDMPIIMKELVQKARGLNLIVSAMEYNIPSRGTEDVAALFFSFPAGGRYADLKRFIFEVETSDRPIGIQDARMESDKGSVKLMMKLVTYIKGRDNDN